MYAGRRMWLPGHRTRPHRGLLPGRHLVDGLCRLQERTVFRHGSALDLPFEAARPEAVWTQGVLMNISDKARFFAEAFLRGAASWWPAGVPSRLGRPLHQGSLIRPLGGRRPAQFSQKPGGLPPDARRDVVSATHVARRHGSAVTQAQTRRTAGVERPPCGRSSRRGTWKSGWRTGLELCRGPCDAGHGSL